MCNSVHTPPLVKEEGENDVPYICVPDDHEDVAFSDAIANDKNLYSDPEMNVSNFDKWSHVKKVFNAEPDITIFAAIRYEVVYEMDDPVKSEAASYVADIRAQYLAKKLEKCFTPEAHLLYLRNVQWMVKLREQSRLVAIQKHIRSQRMH
jgi:hypothetical protein